MSSTTTAQARKAADEQEEALLRGEYTGARAAERSLVWVAAPILADAIRAMNDNPKLHHARVQLICLMEYLRRLDPNNEALPDNYPHSPYSARALDKLAF